MINHKTAEKIIPKIVPSFNVSILSLSISITNPINWITPKAVPEINSGVFLTVSGCSSFQIANSGKDNKYANTPHQVC